MADKVTLDLKDMKSIRDLKAALKAKAEAIEKQNAEDVRYFTEQGEQLAKNYLHMFLGKSSSMESAIGSEYDESTNTGRIFVNHVGAPYVEFGTGWVGELAPHPTGPAPGGFRQGSWVFPVEVGDGQGGEFTEWYTTFGQRSKPFMYSTYQQLMSSIDKKLRAKR